MRKIDLLVPVGVILASGCAGSNFARTETKYGADYRPLTGTGLHAAVVGRSFSFPPPEGVNSSSSCHRFYADGTYEECGDRIAFYHGVYTMTHDRVCATGGPRASCWKLYAAPNGNYLLRDLRSRTDQRICISSLAEQSPPCISH